MNTTEKERFISMLASCNRPNMNNVISNLEQLGFFNAPASTRFHLNTPGGLLTHSLAVLDTAAAIWSQFTAASPELQEKMPYESVIVAALLHDICKAEIYKESYRNQKIDGVWQQVKVYEPDYSQCPLGHGEKSVILLLQWGLPLTEAEMCAIRWHMGAWDINMNGADAKGNISAAQQKHPLVTLLQAADMAATHIFGK